MATLRRLLVLVILLGLVLASGSPLTPPVSAQAPAPPPRASVPPTQTPTAATQAPAAQEPVQAPTDAPVRLPGHTLAAVARATKVTRAAQTAATDPPLALTVTLNRTDEAGFQRFLADVEDPHSTNHGKFISQAETTKRFGPSQQVYDATLAYLQQQGFTLVEGSANRLTLTMKGARAQAEKAFGIQIGEYQLGNRSFFANDQDPAVPGSIAKNIQAVAGLSNLAQPQPNTQGIKSTKDCAYTTDISKAGFTVICGFGFALLHFLWGLVGCD